MAAGIDDVDPALAKHWQATAPRNHSPPDRKSSLAGAAQLPLAGHPALRQQAIARYIQDEAAAQVAALQVVKAPLARDLRALRWTGRWAFRMYERVRGFLIAHAGFVSAQKREYRLTACRACTWGQDRGDGLIICPLMLASCKCPARLLAGRWWVTWLRDKKCPIGRWDEPEKAADDAAAVQQTSLERAKSRSSCGK